MGFRIVLVRHGETIHNVDKRIQGPLIDDPLNERGLAQARALEHRFALEQREGAPRLPRLAAVYASPLRRAFMTAEHVARGARLAPPTPVRALQEFSWGIYLGRTETGETLDAMRALHKRWAAGDLEAAPPEGESPRGAFERAWRDVGPLVERHAAAGDEAIALVAHGRIFKIILSRLVAGDIARMEEFPQGNTAVTLLEHEDGAPWDARWRVVLLNDQSHLTGELAPRRASSDAGPALV